MSRGASVHALADRLHVSPAAVRKGAKRGRLDGAVTRDAKGHLVVLDAPLAVRLWAEQRTRLTPAKRETEADDMPTKAEMRASFEGARKDTITRSEAAALLEVDQESLSQLLPDGLAASVVTWGGRGKELLFSRLLVERWRLARACPVEGQCAACGSILYAAELEAEAALEERHTFADCAECWAPWPRSAPCSRAGQ